MAKKKQALGGTYARIVLPVIDHFEKVCWLKMHLDIEKHFTQCCSNHEFILFSLLLCVACFRYEYDYLHEQSCHSGQNTEVAKIDEDSDEKF